MQIKQCITNEVFSLVRPLGIGKCNLYIKKFVKTSIFQLKYGEGDILCTANALGDNLILTSVARELVNRGAEKIILGSQHPSLFENNPYIKKSHFIPYSTIVKENGWVQGIKYLHYSVLTDIPKICESPKKHIISIMCQKAGVLGEIELLPRLYLLKKELDSYRNMKETVVLQSSIANANWPIINKEWYPDRMQQVVHQLKNQFHLIQVGVKDDPPLDDVIDLRGKLKIREVAALLANSRAFIGMVGFLMHLARSVDCPSAIVYGGREEPWQSGYRCNENIIRKVECSPCWREDLCPYERKCMFTIDSLDVVSAFYHLLDRPRPLKVDGDFIA